MINGVLIVAITAWGIILLFTIAFVCGLPGDSCVSLIWLPLRGGHGRFSIFAYQDWMRVLPTH